MSDKQTIWNALEKLAQDVPTLRTLFASDPQRAKAMSFRAGSIYADFSKQAITPEIHDKLNALLGACDFAAQRDQFFAGAKINTTEDRAVLHPRP